MSRRDAIELALREIRHVERLAILEACAQRPHSPKEVAADGKIGRVAYHFRALAKQKLIRQSRERRVRGAVQHFYALTPKGRRLLVRILDDDAGA